MFSRQCYDPIEKPVYQQYFGLINYIYPLTIIKCSSHIWSYFLSINVFYTKAFGNIFFYYTTYYKQKPKTLKACFVNFRYFNWKFKSL